MKKCICKRCKDYGTCDVNNMTEDQLKKLHCVKYNMSVIGWSFEKATFHIVEADIGEENNIGCL